MEVDATIVDLMEAANTLYAQWPDAHANIHQEEDTPKIFMAHLHIMLWKAVGQEASPD